MTKKEELFVNNLMTNVRALNLTRAKVMVTRVVSGEIPADPELLGELDMRITHVCDSAQILLLEVRSEKPASTVYPHTCGERGDVKDGHGHYSYSWEECTVRCWGLGEHAMSADRKTYEDSKGTTRG